MHRPPPDARYWHHFQQYAPGGVALLVRSQLEVCAAADVPPQTRAYALRALGHIAANGTPRICSGVGARLSGARVWRFVQPHTTMAGWVVDVACALGMLTRSGRVPAPSSLVVEKHFVSDCFDPGVVFGTECCFKTVANALHTSAANAAVQGWGCYVLALFAEGEPCPPASALPCRAVVMTTPNDAQRMCGQARRATGAPSGKCQACSSTLLRRCAPIAKTPWCRSTRVWRWSGWLAKVLPTC